MSHSWWMVNKYFHLFYSFRILLDFQGPYFACNLLCQKLTWPLILSFEWHKFIYLFWIIWTSRLLVHGLWHLASVKVSTFTVIIVVIPLKTWRASNKQFLLSPCLPRDQQNIDGIVWSKRSCIISTSEISSFFITEARFAFDVPIIFSFVAWPSNIIRCNPFLEGKNSRAKGCCRLGHSLQQG